MKAEMFGAVYIRNLINQKINNKYRSILYVCNFAMKK